MKASSEQVAAHFEQLRSFLAASAHLLLSAQHSITAAYEESSTPNELIGAIVDVPAKLRDAADLIAAALAFHRFKS